LRRQSVHRIPHPTFVTIAKRPSWRARDGIGSIPVSTNSKSEKFFAEGLDRNFSDLPVGQISKADTV
jgi:hypothetical protein